MKIPNTYTVVSTSQIIVRELTENTSSNLYIKWAQQLINRGIDNDHLIRLAYLSEHDSYFEVKDLFQKCISSLQIKLLNKQYAVYDFFIEIALACIDGSINFYDCIYTLNDLQNNLSNKFNHYFHDIFILWGFFDDELALAQQTIYPQGLYSIEEVESKILQDIESFINETINLRDSVESHHAT